MSRIDRDSADWFREEAYIHQLRAFIEEQQLTPEEAAQRLGVDVAIVHRLYRDQELGAGLGLETLVCMVLAAGMPSQER